MGCGRGQERGYTCLKLDAVERIVDHMLASGFDQYFDKAVELQAMKDYLVYKKDKNISGVSKIEAERNQLFEFWKVLFLRKRH